MKPMKTLLSQSIFLALAACVSAVAAPPLVLTTGGGVFQIDVDSQGVPSLVRYDGVVLDLRDGEKPPPPKPGGTLAEFVSAATKEIGDPTTARAMAYLYGTMAEAYRDEKVTDPWEQLSKAVDGLLKINGATQRWLPWRQAVAAELNRRGITLSSPKQVQVDAMLAISAGLTDGSSSAFGDQLAAERAIDWAKLIELIKFIMEFLKLLGIG